MSRVVGVIAEDNSDVAVAKRILAKYSPRNACKVKRFVGKGCGPIPRKTPGWARTLFARGCRYLIVIHDLDEANEAELRATLEAVVATTSFECSVVVIPIREIEAWLLTDARALKEAFGMARVPKVPHDTERIAKPKEVLRDLVWKSSRMQYLSTVHNERVASSCRLVKLRRCKSFRILDQYIKSWLS